MPVDEQTASNNWVTISGRTGKVEKLKEMLAQGADINHFDGAATALMYAADRGNLEYVKEILALGADPTRTDNHGKTAVDFAAEAGQKKVVAYLISHGAVHVPHQETQGLLAAIRDGLDVNARDEHGATRLMRAAAAGREHLVEVLLSHRADPLAATRFGHTATMLAVYHGHAAIVGRLFKAGGILPEDPAFLPSAEALKDSGVAKLITKHNPVGFKALWKRRVRVEETRMTLADFERYPVWECCGDEDDATELHRPVPFVEPFDHPVMGIVRVEFVLPGGETFQGYADWTASSRNRSSRVPSPASGLAPIGSISTTRSTLPRGRRWIAPTHPSAFLSIASSR
jgi:hypothetical protein